MFFEFIEHIPNENPNDDDDDTSIGSHRRFTHFLPYLLVKTHDNDDGKNMHETNVTAIGMHCLFTRFYYKHVFPPIDDDGFHLLKLACIVASHTFFPAY